MQPTCSRRQPGLTIPTGAAHLQGSISQVLPCYSTLPHAYHLLFMVVEANSRASKYIQPGVHVQMPSTVSTLADYAGNVVMGVGYLQSYEHMGMFKVECVSGCMCEGMPGRNANWGGALSIYQTAYLAISQSPVCQIRITSLPNTTSGEHKIKFDTVLVATGMTESWSQWFNEMRV